MPRRKGGPVLSKETISKRPEVLLAEELDPTTLPAHPNGGQPLLYRPGFDEMAYRMCLMGATNPKLAAFFNVSEPAIDLWIRKYPKFKEAVHSGKAAADAEVAQSLYHRAKGYSHPATKVMIIDGKPHQEHYTEHHAPDTNAASFWLRNRQPDLWKDKTEVDNTHRVVLTEDQIEERLQKLLNK